MNHIAVNIENVPADRLKSPSFRAITSLLDGLNDGKGLNVVIEITSSQLPPNPPALMKHCLGAERDDELVFERDCPFVIEKENPFENRERNFDRERRFEKGDRDLRRGRGIIVAGQVLTGTSVLGGLNFFGGYCCGSYFYESYDVASVVLGVFILLCMVFWFIVDMAFEVYDDGSFFMMPVFMMDVYAAFSSRRRRRRPWIKASGVAERT